MSQVKLPVLSQADIDLLKEIVARERNRRGNTSQRPAQQVVPPMAPEVYVAFVTADIPGVSLGSDTRTGTGSSETDDIVSFADCTIYRKSGNDTMEAVSGLTKRVYNLSRDPIPAWTWVLVTRDKFGVWWVCDKRKDNLYMIQITDASAFPIEGTLHVWNPDAQSFDSIGPVGVLSNLTDNVYPANGHRYLAHNLDYQDSGLDIWGLDITQTFYGTITCLGALDLVTSTPKIDLACLTDGTGELVTTSVDGTGGGYVLTTPPTFAGSSPQVINTSMVFWLASWSFPESVPDSAPCYGISTTGFTSPDKIGVWGTTFDGDEVSGGIITAIGAGPWVTPPATDSSAGTAGQIAYDSTYFYICIATDTWKRVAIASWSSISSGTGTGCNEVGWTDSFTDTDAVDLLAHVPDLSPCAASYTYDGLGTWDILSDEIEPATFGGSPSQAVFVFDPLETTYTLTVDLVWPTTVVDDFNSIAFFVRVDGASFPVVVQLSHVVLNSWLLTVSDGTSTDSNAVTLVATTPYTLTINVTPTTVDADINSVTSSISSTVQASFTPIRVKVQSNNQVVGCVFLDNLSVF